MSETIKVAFNMWREWSQSSNAIPANTGHWPCARSMLAHHLRRWPNIEPAHGQCPCLQGCFHIGQSVVLPCDEWYQNWSSFGWLSRLSLPFQNWIVHIECAIKSWATNNTRREPSSGLTLVQRLWRWPNIKPALCKRVVLGKERPSQLALWFFTCRGQSNLAT